jgi:hypothetical protein
MSLLHYTSDFNFFFKLFTLFGTTRPSLALLTDYGILAFYTIGTLTDYLEVILIRQHHMMRRPSIQ